MQQEKDVKTLAKEAKKRLKSGFWEKYKEEVVEKSRLAKASGVKTQEVVEFYQSKEFQTVTKDKEDEESFYLKVKEILDKEGEMCLIFSKLIDHEIYDNLTYDAKQKYTLELAEKYQKALQRYKKEKNLKN